jgi:hypothetical protein
MPTELTGRAFTADLGAFVPRLTFVDAGRMRVEADLGTQSVDELVDVDVVEVAPRLLMVSWTESSGVFVVQLHDHAAGRVHNRARLPNGDVFRAEGALTAV